ncbi:FHA domain-containing protein [Hyphomicrobium methylovorum]|uniref:FHA domain-containing protein n=1 Tax=Hyphomicrobium methylovorum TaxID=84 RepID=UPI0015E6FFC7|nr:FHA domain-containing protein [Hyphomicrobium methylovorum]MBA2125985.1 FHA domain-containing protein [Hyphomicrobium methylovorum]
MTVERGDTTEGHEAKPVKAHKFLGSLRDALMAAGRDDTLAPVAVAAAPAGSAPESASADLPAPADKPRSLSAEEAARLARTEPTEPPPLPVIAAASDSDHPPTTRVVRHEKPAKAPVEEETAPRTVLVRGRQPIVRGTFERDPVVGFLIIVGGPGLGSYRPIFEGNNTVGRSADNRIPLDFGDDAISNEAQAYLRYDSSDRSFLFVPNLAKTNVVSVNDKRPAGPVPLQPMDVITLGRTQVAFLPFCGSEFDWSEISDA